MVRANALPESFFGNPSGLPSHAATLANIHSLQQRLNQKRLGLIGAISKTNQVTRQSLDTTDAKKEAADKKKYLKEVKNFLREAKKLRNHARAEIFAAARTITDLCDAGWQDQPAILHLWYALTLAAANLSDHPSKPVAALFINNKTGELIEFDVNRIPDGMKRRPDYMVEGIRSGIVVCAERNAVRSLIAQRTSLNLSFDEKSISIERDARYSALKAELKAEFPGRKLEDIRKEKLLPKWRDAQIEIMQRNVKVFSQALADAAHSGTVLDNIVVITAPQPCTECARVLVSHRPALSVFNSKYGQDFTRSPDNPAARKLLCDGGVPIRDLAQTLETFTP